MRLLEMEQSVRDGRLKVDGNIVLNEDGELAVTKGISRALRGDIDWG
jgi:hypothetical protein